MGNSLYIDEEQLQESSSSFEGLLRWNRKWDLPSKDYIGRLQKELQTGCIDDLDFACKLFTLYERKVQGIPEKVMNDWSERYFINNENFERIITAREEILDIFTKGKKSTWFRPINLSLIDRLRLLMTMCWPDRIVKIIEQGNHLIFENQKTKVKGILSDNSAGTWAKNDEVIIGLLDQSDWVLDGSRKGSPLITFAIKVPDKIIESGTPDSLVVSELMKSKKEFDIEKKSYSLYSHLFAPVGAEISLNGKKKEFTSAEVNLPPLFIPSFEENSFVYSDNEKFDSSKVIAQPP